MTASATSSSISITDPIGVKVAGSHSRGWMHSTGIVSVFSVFSLTHPQLNTLQYAQKVDKIVRRPKTTPKPVVRSIPLASVLEIRWDPVLQILLAASWRWTSTPWVVITVAASKLNLTVGWVAA